MSFITIILFFIYSFGLGLTATFFTKNSDNFLERNLIRIGIGLGAFVLLGVILNLFRIPMDWKIFLFLSLIVPLIFLARTVKSKKFPQLNLKITKNNLAILMVIFIFLISAFMYIGGSFKYPYLENDDPWVHAESAKYISEKKTLSQPEDYELQYLDPYPPGYALLMGVMHQTSSSLYWTLKFFNGLVISLGILFFYFFAKTFTQDRNKALFSTFVLAALPSFFTHFIWAHTLVVMLFFPALYCLEMIKIDKKWRYPAMITISAIFLTQPSQALKIGIMLGIFLIIKSIYEKKFLINILSAEVGGVVISLIWWIFKAPSLLAGRMEKAVAQTSVNEISSGGFFSKTIFFVLNYFRPDSGTASRPYSLSDFIWANSSGGINVHVGWGLVVSALVVLALIFMAIKYKEIFRKENSWVAITFLWFIFTFLGVNAMSFHLPLGFITFRFWLLLAIPVALLSSVGLWFLIGLGKKVSLPALFIIFIVVLGVTVTAGYQKYHQNTLSTWPPGAAWTSGEEIQGFLWLRTLPPETKVFTYSTTDKFIIGLDKKSCFWCSEVISFRENLIEHDSESLYNFLKTNQYEYLVLSGMSYNYLSKKFGSNETQKQLDLLLEEVQNSVRFSPAYQTQGAVILKIN